MRAEIVCKFETIYESESDAIFRFCLMRVSSREQALDITQETFLSFWQTLFQDKEVANSRAFLFTIARHLIIDWYRKKKSFSLDYLLQFSSETELGVMSTANLNDTFVHAEGRQLIEHINELPDTYRDAVYLRFVEDLLPQEISAVLGISTNVASVRITRGLIELRKKMRYTSH